MVLETNTLELGMLAATGVLLLGPLSFQNREIYVNTNMYVYPYLSVFLYVTTYVYSKVNISSSWYRQL